jgi:hypothetical protein
VHIDQSSHPVGPPSALTVEQNLPVFTFRPLGMRNSYFTIDKHNEDSFVVGITVKGKKSKPWEMKFINPAGAIKSTLNDMITDPSARAENRIPIPILLGQKLLRL